MAERGSSINRRAFVKTAGAAAAATVANPAVLRAQERVLTFSSWLPAASLVAQNFTDVWVEDVNRLTAGRVRIEVLERPLGPPPAHYDLLKSGGTDIAYTIHGYSKDLFERAAVGQFSFLGDTYSISHAFSKVYGDTLDAAAEHEGVRLLSLFQHGPGALMLKDKRIRTPDDFKGLRLRTSGGYVGALMADLGAENVPMSPTAVRAALEEGRIDGVAFPYEAGPAFGIMDQITSVSDLPGGYYNATWFLGMSEAAAERISAEDLSIIERYSAETAHVLAAKAFDYADYLGREEFKTRAIQIDPAPPEVIARVKEVGGTYEADWSRRLSDAGYDGAEALAYLRRSTGVKY